MNLRARYDIRTAEQLIAPSWRQSRRSSKGGLKTQPRGMQVNLSGGSSL
jgi:hypothetical protein